MALTETKKSSYFFNKMINDYPNASILRVDSFDSLFDDDTDFYDAVLVSAEAGSALTLLHPEFSVVVPRPGTFTAPLSFAMAKNSQQFAEFFSAWMDIKKKEGDFQRYYDYWILGKTSVNQQPRWSVIRDVLGWVD